MLQRNVFREFDLRIDRSRPQKRLVLGPEDRPLPLMAWSAGQREFVPLLLGFYWLMPSLKVTTRGDDRVGGPGRTRDGTSSSCHRCADLDDIGAGCPGLPGLSVDALVPGYRSPLGSPKPASERGLRTGITGRVRSAQHGAHAKARRDCADEERQGLLLRLDHGRNQRYL